MSSTESHPYHGLDQPDTSNATWFIPKEKSINEMWKESDRWNSCSAFRYQSKQKWWKYLEELNQGVRNGKHTNDPYWTFRDNSDLIGNVADQIGTSDSQAHRAKLVFFHLHGSKISGVRKDATAVAVVAFVIENDSDDYRRFHPQVEADTGITVADSLGAKFALSANQIVSIYGKVQHHLRVNDSLSKPPQFDSYGMDRHQRSVQRDENK